MNLPSRRWALAPWAVLIAALLPFAISTATFELLATGDGYSVYYPVIWALADGEGLSALDHLGYGAFRAPLFAVVLYLTSAGGANIAMGSALLTAAAAAVCLALAARARPDAQPLGSCITILLIACSPAFVHAMSASTPDLLASALGFGAIVVSRRHPDARGWFATGILIGLATLARFNAVALLWALPCLAPPGRHARQFVVMVTSGLLLASLPWVAVSAAAGHGFYWVPSGPTIRDVLPVVSRIEDPASLLGALRQDPLGLPRALLGNVPRTATGAIRAMGWTLLALVVAHFVFSKREERRLALLDLGGLILFAFPLLFVPAEARYFLIPVLVLASRAALAPSLLLERWRTPARIAVAALSATTLALGSDIWLDRHRFFRIADSIHEECSVLVDVARHMGPNPIDTDALTYLHTPMRYHFRTAGMDATLRCCGAEIRRYLIQIARHPTIERTDLVADEGLGLTVFRVERRADAPPLATIQR